MGERDFDVDFDVDADFDDRLEDFSRMLRYSGADM